MRRKLILQGNKSFTLTVPIEWVKDEALKPSDDVEITREDSKLIIEVPAHLKKREIPTFIDLNDYHNKTIRNILNQTYRKGFDSIHIKFHKKEQLNSVKDITKETLLGFEVTEENEDSCIVQNIAEPSSDKYEVILKKIFFMIKAESDEILKSLKENQYDQSKRDENKNLLDNYTNFVRRIIIKEKIGGSRDSYLYFYAASRLSYIHHAYYYLHKFMSKKNKMVGKDILKLFENTNQMFDDYYNAFFKKDLQLAHQVGVWKDRLLEKDIFDLLQKKKGFENVIIYHLGEIIRNIHLSSTVLFGLIIENQNL